MHYQSERTRVRAAHKGPTSCRQPAQRDVSTKSLAPDASTATLGRVGGSGPQHPHDYIAGTTLAGPTDIDEAISQSVSETLVPWRKAGTAK